MNIKGKKISAYAAALVVTVIGTGATLLIMDSIKKADDPFLYSGAADDPLSQDADFEKR